MDDNAIAALKAAYEASTQGEWEAMHFEASSSVMTDDQSYARQSIVETQYPTDAAFIVAAHEYVPALLAEVEKLRAALKPFARQYPNWAYAGDEMDVDIDVTAGDLRRAADALNAP